MRIMLEEDLAHCRTLTEVLDQSVETISAVRNDGFTIHYVAGPVSCDGEPKIPENLAALITTRTVIMHSLGEGAVVFTAPFIFTDEVRRNLDIFRLPPAEREAQLQWFWDELLGAGVVDAVHLARGWGRSPGTNRERETALRLGIPVTALFEAA